MQASIQVSAAILAGLPAGTLWLWLIHFPDEHPLHTGLLYYLAAARGISMHGRRQASRYTCWGRDARNAPRSSRLSYRFLARVFHVSRKAISEAMRWLWRQGWVVISKYGAWEPRYDVLRQRYALSSPKNRFKVSPAVLRDHGPTAAFVHGKVAKTDGMYRVTYRQTTRSLAESIGYAIRTMCRHATRLCAESLMCVFGRTRWGRYYSLCFSTLESSEGEKVLPVRQILRALSHDVEVHSSRGPPVESYGRLALEHVSKGQSVLASSRLAAKRRPWALSVHAPANEGVDPERAERAFQSWLAAGSPDLTGIRSIAAWETREAPAS